MEQPAIELGVPANLYWSLTFKEIMLEINALRVRRERDIKEKAMFDYNLVQGMAMAFNSPQKIPKAEKMYPMLAEEQKEVLETEKPKQKDIVPVTAEQDKMMFMKMAEVVKNHNKNKE